MLPYYFRPVFLLALLLLWLPAGAQRMYFPPAAATGEWSRLLPAEVGMQPDSLRAAVEFAQAHEYSGSRDLRVAILEGYAHEPFHTLAGPTRHRGGPAGLVLKNGFIIAEWGDLQRVDMTFSVTKSFLSTVAGLAWARGLLPNLQEPVAQRVWDGSFEGAHNSQITWEHLLTQSSDWSGDLWDMPDWSDRPPATGSPDEWRRQTPRPPGTAYEYNDVRVNALAYALLQVWRRPLPAVLRDEIMDPIGASSTWRWYGYHNSWVELDGQRMQSVSGGGHSGGGLFINTLDLARFGLLFLNQGQWGRRAVLPDAWLPRMLQPSAANPAYGYLWWLNQGKDSWPGVPADVYYAAGFGGNYVVVAPSLQLVVVTRWLEPNQIGELMRRVVAATRK